MTTLRQILLIPALCSVMCVWGKNTPLSFAQTSGPSSHDAEVSGQAGGGALRDSMAESETSDFDFYREQHGPGPGYRSFQRSSSHFGHQQEQVVVIPAADTLVPVMSEVHVDMRVMSHIIRQSLERSTLSLLNVRSGFTDFGEFFQEDQAMKALFVEDYGVLFLATVDFPLGDSAANRMAPDSQKEPMDTTWKDVRNEITAPGYGRRSRSLSQGPAYDQERIELIKTELIKTFKYASNIRHLSAEAWIVIRLSNPGGGSSFHSEMTMGSVSTGEGGGFGASGGFSAGGGGFGYSAGSVMPEPNRTTTLCLRVQKAHADAFDQGQLDSKAFQGKVKVMTY